MAIKIDQAITGVSVVSAPTPESAEIIEMHERLERPERLVGATYKIKTPFSPHALYVTINDIVLNEATAHEHRRPFEIFINSKAMEHFQWIVALTRIISAVFRKGGDVTFLVDEMRSVFDPKGGYFKKGGKYMPSLVAEIGDVIETHLRSIGLLETPHDPARDTRIDEARIPFAGTQAAPNFDFPSSAQLCPVCQTKALVAAENCLTCLKVWLRKLCLLQSFPMPAAQIQPHSHPDRAPSRW